MAVSGAVTVKSMVFVVAFLVVALKFLTALGVRPV